MPSKAIIILFRHKLLLLLPFLIALPISIIFVIATGSKKYQSAGTVWVDRPEFFVVAGTNRWSQFISPAANQAGFLRERLSTNDFSSRIATRASEGFSRVISKEEVRAGTWVNGGSNLVTVGHAGSDPEAAARIAKAAIDVYGEVDSDQTIAGAEQAVSFYQARLKEQRDAVTAATSKLKDSPNDVFLQNQLQEAQNTYNEKSKQLDQVELLIKQTKEGSIVTWNPRDQPEVPLAPVPRKKLSLLGPPAMATLLSIAVAAAVFAFLLHTDRTLRSAEDLVLVPGVQLIGIVPDVSLVGRPTWPRQFVRIAASSGTDPPPPEIDA